MRPVPDDRTACGERWDHYCAEILEMTPAAERAVDMALHDKIQDLPGLPTWTTPIQREIITPLLKLTAIGGLPPIVRDRFDIPFGPRRRRRSSRLLELWVRQTWRFVPRPMRWAPRASDGWRREAAPSQP